MDSDLVTAVLIGSVDREAQSIIERELVAAGIACYIEGSVVYGVQVRRQDVARARQIIAASAALKDHWVQFPFE